MVINSFLESFQTYPKVFTKTQLPNLIMQVIIVLALIAYVSAGAIPATYLTRAPQFDSAVIKSDRLGGNFAYSVAESHAYAQHTPIVQNVATPVAVSSPAVVPVQTVQTVAYAGQPAYSAVSAPVTYSTGAYHVPNQHFAYNYPAYNTAYNTAYPSYYNHAGYSYNFPTGYAYNNGVNYVH